MRIPRLSLGAGPLLDQADDAYELVDQAAESPRRRTLVYLVGTATAAIEAAADGWERGIAGERVRDALTTARQAILLADLLGDVVVRHAGEVIAPSAAELELTDRARAALGELQPALVLAEDVAAEVAAAEATNDRPVESDSDQILDVFEAVTAIRDRFQSRNDAPLPDDREAREAALLDVTLHRHCLERCVAALEALNDDDRDAAIRDLRAGLAACQICESRLPPDVHDLTALLSGLLNRLQQ